MLDRLWCNYQSVTYIHILALREFVYKAFSFKTKDRDENKHDHCTTILYDVVL